MTPVPIPADEVDMWRDRLAWHFDSFCRDGSYEPETLIAEVRDKKRQLWVAWHQGEVRAAVLTTVQDDLPQTCVITHGAGEGYRDWIHLLRFIEDWARGIGCKRLQAVARPGWERVLGMKKTHVVLERAL